VRQKQGLLLHMMAAPPMRKMALATCAAKLWHDTADRSRAQHSTAQHRSADCQDCNGCPQTCPANTGAPIKYLPTMRFASKLRARCWTHCTSERHPTYHEVHLQSWVEAVCCDLRGDKHGNAVGASLQVCKRAELAGCLMLHHWCFEGWWRRCITPSCTSLQHTHCTTSASNQPWRFCCNKRSY